MDEKFLIEETKVNKSERRSSILKREKLQQTNNSDEIETDPTPKPSRRVSFASSNFIKPFAADPERNTIWDTTYEEAVVDATNSTKSSDGKSQYNNTDCLNMSSIVQYDHTTNSACDNISARSILTSVTQEDLIVNKENIYFQDIMYMKTRERQETISTMSMNMEITELLPSNDECMKENMPNRSDDSASNSEPTDLSDESFLDVKIRYHGDETMELTTGFLPPPRRPVGILKNKSSNETFYNVPNHQKEKASRKNSRRFCDVKDSMDFTALMRKARRQRGMPGEESIIRSDETMEMTGNLSRYCFPSNIDSKQRTFVFDDEMEMTSMVRTDDKSKLEPAFNQSSSCKNFDSNFILPISSGDVNEGLSVFSTAKRYISKMEKKRKKKSSLLEDNSELINTQPDLTKYKNKIDSTMEITSNIANAQSTQHRDMYVNKMQPHQLETTRFQSFLDQKSVVDIDMELTSVLSKNSKECVMDTTDNLTRAKIFDNNNIQRNEMQTCRMSGDVGNQMISKQTVKSQFNVSSSDSVLPDDETLFEEDCNPKKIIQITRKKSDSMTRTRVFEPSEGDMEFSTTVSNVIFPTSGLKISDESSMETTRNLTRGEIIKRRDIQVNENEIAEQETYLTKMGNVEKKSNQMMKESCDSRRKACVLHPWDGEDVEKQRKSEQRVTSQVNVCSSNLMYTSVLPDDKTLFEEDCVPKQINQITRKKSESMTRTRVFEPSEGDMEISTTVSNVIFPGPGLKVSDESGMERTQNSPCGEIINRTGIQGCENQIAKQKTYLTKIGNEEKKVNQMMKENYDSTRKTCVSDPSSGGDVENQMKSEPRVKSQFNICPGDVMYTSVLPNNNTLFEEQCVPKRINQITRKKSDSMTRTRVFEPSEGDMEFSTTVSNVICPDLGLKISDESSMETTQNLTRGEIIKTRDIQMSENEVTKQETYLTKIGNEEKKTNQMMKENYDSRRKACVFDPLDGENVVNQMKFEQRVKSHFNVCSSDMMYTSVLPDDQTLFGEDCVPNQITRKKSDSMRKTRVFEPSEGDMELSTTVSNVIFPDPGLKIPDESNTETTQNLNRGEIVKRRDVQVSEKQIGEQETYLTKIGNEERKDNQMIKENCNSRRQTCIFDPSNGDMEFTLTLSGGNFYNRELKASEGSSTAKRRNITSAKATEHYIAEDEISLHSKTSFEENPRNKHTSEVIPAQVCRMESHYERMEEDVQMNETEVGGQLTADISIGVGDLNMNMEQMPFRDKSGIETNVNTSKTSEMEIDNVVSESAQFSKNKMALTSESLINNEFVLETSLDLSPINGANGQNQEESDQIIERTTLVGPTESNCFSTEIMTKHDKLYSKNEIDLSELSNDNLAKRSEMSETEKSLGITERTYTLTGIQRQKGIVIEMNKTQSKLSLTEKNMGFMTLKNKSENTVMEISTERTMEPQTTNDDKEDVNNKILSCENSLGVMERTYNVTGTQMKFGENVGISKTASKPEGNHARLYQIINENKSLSLNKTSNEFTTVKKKSESNVMEIITEHVIDPQTTNDDKEDLKERILSSKKSLGGMDRTYNVTGTNKWKREGVEMSKNQSISEENNGCLDQMYNENFSFSLNKNNVDFSTVKNKSGNNVIQTFTQQIIEPQIIKDDKKDAKETILPCKQSLVIMEQTHNLSGIQGGLGESVEMGKNQSKPEVNHACLDQIGNENLLLSLNKTNMDFNTVKNISEKNVMQIITEHSLEPQTTNDYKENLKERILSYKKSLGGMDRTYNVSDSKKRKVESVEMSKNQSNSEDNHASFDQMFNKNLSCPLNKNSMDFTTVNNKLGNVVQVFTEQTESKTINDDEMDDKGNILTCKKSLSVMEKTYNVTGTQRQKEASVEMNETLSKSEENHASLDQIYNENLLMSLNKTNMDFSAAKTKSENNVMQVMTQETIRYQTTNDDNKDVKEKILSCSKKFGGNILYSEPVKIKMGDQSCESDQIITTPDSSFFLTPVLEDTQLLINANVSNPESFKLELSRQIIQRSKQAVDDEKEGVQQLDAVKDRIRGPKEISRPNYYSLSDESVELVQDNDHFQLSTDKSHPLQDEKVELVQDNISNEIERSEQLGSPNNTRRYSDYQNYTLRSQRVLPDLSKYLRAPTEDDIAVEESTLREWQDLIQQRLKRGRKRLELLKNFKIPDVSLDLLEDISKGVGDTDSISSSSGMSNRTSIGVTTEESIECLIPHALYEKVRSAAERSKRHWQLAKNDNDCYCFYALQRMVPFKVKVHPETGIVHNVVTYRNTGAEAHPIIFYNAEVLQQKLKEENLSSTLGTKYDILTLLDYVSITVQQIIEFHVAFNRIQRRYRYHHIRFNEDFRVSFKVLSVRLTISWVISVKLSVVSIGCPEDISAFELFGEKVDVAAIDKIGNNTLKNVNFLENFVTNIDEFVEKTGKKLKFR